MNSPPAFTDQIKKQLSALNFSYHPQPEAHWNIPGLFLNSILLHAARWHRDVTPATAATPGCTGAATTTGIFPTLPGVPTPFFLAIFLHLPPLHSKYITTTARLPTPTVLLFLLNRLSGIAGKVLNCRLLREGEVSWGHWVHGCQWNKPDLLSIQSEHTCLRERKGH